jgi:hypothetical protein
MAASPCVAYRGFEQAHKEFPAAVPKTQMDDAAARRRKKPADFVAAHTSVHNHFNTKLQLHNCDIFKVNAPPLSPRGAASKLRQEPSYWGS